MNLNLNKPFAEKLAWSFARAFGGSMLVLLPGVWAAPDFNAGKALAISALVASVTAGFRAVQHVLVD